MGVSRLDGRTCGSGCGEPLRANHNKFCSHKCAEKTIGSVENGKKCMQCDGVLHGKKTKFCTDRCITDPLFYSQLIATIHLRGRKSA